MEQQNPWTMKFSSFFASCKSKKALKDLWFWLAISALGHSRRHLHPIHWSSMGDISQILAVTRREHSASFSSDATQSTASRLVLRHRLHQLMTCLDDLDPTNDLHDKVVKTLDNAFVVFGRRASKPKKDKFRWRECFCFFFYRNSFTVLLKFSFVVEHMSLIIWSLWFQPDLSVVAVTGLLLYWLVVLMCFSLVLARLNETLSGS